MCEQVPGIMAVEPRTERIDLRVAASEVKMLRELAEAEGLSQAGILRQCIRQRHAAKFGERPVKKKR